jgi:hypothetical protein
MCHMLKSVHHNGRYLDSHTGQYHLHTCKIYVMVNYVGIVHMKNIRKKNNPNERFL